MNKSEPQREHVPRGAAEIRNAAKSMQSSPGRRSKATLRHVHTAIGSPAGDRTKTHDARCRRLYPIILAWAEQAFIGVGRYGTTMNKILG
jgi:hypothetical protein